ncbi:MAG: aminotransferase class V-fold PLP-dependent enzyme [Oscillospiraceae bacterium]|nr:aminotransferase class V-fold PLP-dependent enzyme [Oscillospiraceae bacterium]
MKTPIYDFLENYSRSDTLRLHMPGHKGKAFAPLKAFECDITEISGADSLFEASGIIAESEKNTSRLYHTVRTCYSTGGSTLCIQTMLALMKQENRTVIAVRNVHRSFLAACALLDIQPLWLFPDYSGGILSGGFPYDKAEEMLKRHKNACIYLTSPDYLGKTADIGEVSKLCHRYNAVLLVDNAHGAHTISMGCHPSQLGADICCDSAHKMLPALTGGAYLHIMNPAYADRAKGAMSLFGSTSPSYLIMASLDLCAKYIAECLEDDVKGAVCALDALRKRISGRYDVYSGEPFHLTLLCDGKDLAGQLRGFGIECEYADSGCIVLLFSPVNTPDEIEKTGDILMQCSPKPPVYSGKLSFPQPETALRVREAVLGDYEEIPVEESEGRICAGVNVPCPPAVPVAASGEVIDKNCIKIFKRYGILTVNVVK